MSAMADIAYNNTLPNPSNCCSGWTIGGSGSLVGLVGDAQLFMSATTGTVSEISVDLGWAAGDNGAFVGIYTNNAGAPGTLVGRWVALPPAPALGPSGAACPLSVLGRSGTLLAAQQYF